MCSGKNVSPTHTYRDNGRGLTQQPVFSHNGGWGGYGGARQARAADAQRPQPAPVQLRTQRITSHGVASGAQSRPQVAGAITPGIARECGLRRHLQRGSGGLGAAPPLVMAGAADAQHVAEHLHGPGRHAGANELIVARDGGGWKKMVTTFFNTARSISTRLDSVRSRLISSRAAPLGTAFSRAWRYQRPNSAGERPWAWATSVCRAPAATWRAHSALKAGVYFFAGGW